jgi:hypothetical protein
VTARACSTTRRTCRHHAVLEMQSGHTIQNNSCVLGSRLKLAYDAAGAWGYARDRWASLGLRFGGPDVGRPNRLRGTLELLEQAGKARDGAITCAVHWWKSRGLLGPRNLSRQPRKARGVRFGRALKPTLHQRRQALQRLAKCETQAAPSVDRRSSHSEIFIRSWRQTALTSTTVVFA